MLRIPVFIVFVIQCLGFVLAQDYCSLCGNHTMCLPKVGPECEPLMSSGVTLKQEDEIVDTHNKLRRRIAKGKETSSNLGGMPMASNMMLMKWDNELAAIAQRWANQCSFNHDECRDVERFPVGQNIRITSSSVADSRTRWKETVKSWYSEVQYFHPSSIDPFEFNEDAGHFSQVIWAESMTVGCGLSHFQAERTGPWYKKFYVCNYGPAGNVMDDSMYQEGQPCVTCPEGAKCDDGLCVL